MKCVSGISVSFLRNITNQMDAYQAEYAEVAESMNNVFDLLEDCGRAYKLADDYQKRCFNQALFEKIKVYKDLTIEVDYAEPFDTLLNLAVFELKYAFGKNEVAMRKE
jgi:hypothetical protein